MQPTLLDALSCCRRPPLTRAPGLGAETGAGGRMRDTHATGIGSLMGAGLAGYCVGNLRLEGAPAPWEDPDFAYPDSLASPLQARHGLFASLDCLCRSEDRHKGQLG